MPEQPAIILARLYEARRLLAALIAALDREASRLRIYHLVVEDEIPAITDARAFLRRDADPPAP